MKLIITSVGSSSLKSEINFIRLTRAIAGFEFSGLARVIVWGGGGGHHANA